MNLIEKILARHSGRETVRHGEFLNIAVDCVFGNELTGYMALKEFKGIRERGVKIHDPASIILFADHFTPNKDIQTAMMVKELKEFCASEGIAFFDVGQVGIEHVLLPEIGVISPNDVVVGGDSHSVTHGALSTFSTGVGSTDIASIWALGEMWVKVPPSIKVVLKGHLNNYSSGKDVILNLLSQIGVSGAIYSALEFSGEGISSLNMSDRFTICNMSVECGAKCAVFPADEKTDEFLKGVGHSKKYDLLTSDDDADYVNEIVIDLKEVEPQIAFPYSPDNVRGISCINEDILIDQVVIGSCTNGRIEDLRVAAGVLRDQKASPGVRVIIIPGSQNVYLKALQEGLLEIFVRAGCAISPPTCGPCCGGHMGILAAGERCVSTTNRNFAGRMGHPKSEVYLVNPAVAAASALCGKIAGPDKVNN